MERNVLPGDHEMSDLHHSSRLGRRLAYRVVETSNGRLAVDREAEASNRVVVELQRICA